MALKHTDSFDDRDINHIGDRYGSYALNQSAGAGITPGRTGNGLILSTGILDGFDFIQWESPTTHQSLYAGIARYNNRGALLSLRYNGTPQIFAQRNGDGTVSVIRYDGGLNTVLGTSARSLAGSGWFYIELFGKIDTINGAYEMRVDGTRWLSASGVNTSSTGDAFANQVRVINNSALSDGSASIIDDFYIADNDTDGGDALITGFAGPVHIACLEENANGATNEWTPHGGTNYQAVGETTGEDADATYNAGGTHRGVDLYGLTDVEIVGVQIKAVASHQWVRKEDALYRGMLPMARVGATNYEGDEEVLGTNYERVFQAWERNPATSAAWLLSEVNSVQIGAMVNHSQG